MSGKYQVFEPGKYFDWEKAVIEERLNWVGKGPPKSQQPPITVSEYELLNYNAKWDSYNPLFNNKGYAHQVARTPCVSLSVFRRRLQPG